MYVSENGTVVWRVAVDNTLMSADNSTRLLVPSALPLLHYISTYLHRLEGIANQMEIYNNPARPMGTTPLEDLTQPSGPDVCDMVMGHWTYTEVRHKFLHLPPTPLYVGANMRVTLV